MNRVFITKLNELYKRRSNLLSDKLFGTTEVIISENGGISGFSNSHFRDDEINHEIEQVNEQIEEYEKSLYKLLKSQYDD